jgi:oligosaccharide repeat unit polymerase
MITKKLYINLPIVILLCEWALVFYLHFNNPYHFIIMSRPTLNLILLGLFGLIIGYYTIHSFLLSHNTTFDTDVRKISVNQRALGIVILILSSIVFLGLLLSIREISKITNNLSLYFSNPFAARALIIQLQDGEIQNISVIAFKIGSYLNSLMYPLAVLGGIMVSQKSRWRYIGVLPLILVILYSLIYLNRFGLIVSLGFWFFSMFYFSIYMKNSDREELLKKIVLYIIIALIFVLLFFYLILSIRGFYITDLSYYVKRSFYAYFSGSPSALEKLLHEPSPGLMYGMSSFRSIAKWFVRLGLLEPATYVGAHNTFKNISGGTSMAINTYTFVKTLFEDFGRIGVAFFTVIWGGLTRYSVEKSFKKFSLNNLFIVSVFLLSFFMSFYEFFFQGITMFIYWWVILLIINKYLTKKNIIIYE